MASYQNPYAPPGSVVADPAPGRSPYPDASLWRRFFNYLADAFVTQLAVVPAAAVLAFVAPAALESVWVNYGLTLVSLIV